MFWRGPIAWGLSLGVLWLVGCGSTPKRVEPVLLQGEALGTTWSVKWIGDFDAEVARQETEAVLAEVDAAMSTWRDDSELSRARRSDGPLDVSEPTWDVTRRALTLAEETGGAFDPTVQPLMELWGFHGQERTSWPTDEEIVAAQARTGWEKVALGRSNGRGTIDVRGTALDLSAIAKGYSVDRVSGALSGLGILAHLVEVGGEVRAQGRGPGGGGWLLGIDAPSGEGAPGSQLVGVVPLMNSAMATSGNYRNRRSIGGRAVGHTMDPRTGRPAEDAPLSVTVLAPSCTLADGWATALMVLGADRGLRAMEARPELQAVFVVQGEGGWELRSTQAMPLRQRP